MEQALFIIWIGSGTPAYSVSKAALNAFSCILAAELQGTGILVNYALLLNLL
jgi:NAD(P)-dependent dehydrogenase (short-subunit alcohol dehydrogenase family)